MSTQTKINIKAWDEGGDSTLLSKSTDGKQSDEKILSVKNPKMLITAKTALQYTIYALLFYLLCQSAVYYYQAKQQQKLITEELGELHISAEKGFNHSMSLQKMMEDKLENIDVLAKQISRKMKNMLSYSENELPEEYTEEAGDQCELTPLVLRFDCHPELGASESSCTKRGCCWHPLHALNWKKQIPLDVPYCYYPKNWSLYKYRNFSKNGNDFSGLLNLQGNSYYKGDIPLIKIESSDLDDAILQVKIFDPSKKRYEPPFPKRSNPEVFPSGDSGPHLDLKMDENSPGFKVVRSDDKHILFNSVGIGGFIFADQFLQISSTLPSHNIYGLGEHRSNLKLNTHWQKITLFNADQAPTEDKSLYGSHPFYMVLEQSGKAHGVLFLNSNAMDVILQPTPAITFRSIGGIFDLYFFAGPTPADVLKQYSRLVGKPFLPPYWSLGFHLCKYGYGSTEKTREVWQRTREALIPLDVQWNDIDYMDRYNDFTYDKTNFKGLPDFIKELHSVGMHYVPIIDAGVSASEKTGTYIPYDEGVRKRVFIYDSRDDVPFKGKVWNLVSTAWPDFTNPNTSSYYTEMLASLHESLGYDGAWLDMNEPSNFYNGHADGCEKTSLDFPPYLPGVNGNLLSMKTLCMNAKQHLGNHYDLHNLFGTSQSIVVNQALKKIRNKRPFIISRSTWVGHGFYAGHWTGDVFSTWHDLKVSIPEILAFSLFQVPMVGADICGFNGNTTAALCNRWMQLGAFYPFSRNHNSDDTIEQDPVAMGQMVVMSSRKALTARYYLLPYLYSLFYRAHLYGETVARPLFIEFYNDSQTYHIDTQFLWGSCLLISPVLEDGKTDVEAYLPRGFWYDFYTMESSFSVGKNFTLDAPLDTIPLLVRGGCVLPVQETSSTTTLSRQKPFGLIVSLDEQGSARGELYWDDGDSLDSIESKEFKHLKFEVDNSQLVSSVVEGNYRRDMKLGKITIMGVTKLVRQVYLNDKPTEFEYDKEKNVLLVDNLSLDFGKKLVLRWTNKKEDISSVTTSVESVHQSVSTGSSKMKSHLGAFFDGLFQNSKQPTNSAVSHFINLPIIASILATAKFYHMV